MTGYSFLKAVTYLNKGNLEELVNLKAFHKTNNLIKNRVPLGSIKVPLNLEDEAGDFYIQDGN